MSIHARSGRNRLGLSLAPLLLVSALPAHGASPATARDQAIAQMPSRVMSDGLTVAQQLERQARLSGQLLAELRGAPALRTVRIAVDPAEIAAIEAPETPSTPLKIGLVKSMTPAVEVFGLEPGPPVGKPRRSASAPASLLRDGSLVWALSVQAGGAGAIRLHLEDFSLPEGAELYVYTRAGEAYGPYTGAGPDGSGDFWATTVFGSEAIVQLHLPAHATPAALAGVSFRVTEVGIVAQRFVPGLAPAASLSSFCGNPSCIVDASCYSAASSIEDAYAKMEWVQGAYIYSCTGGLLNDSNPTQSNFFLTANHCFSKNSTARNVTFYWRFRTSTCNGSCPADAGWPYKTTGATVAASGRKGDFTLVHLNADPPAGSVFLGWTNVAVANTDGVALHRVSNPNFGPEVYNEQTVDTSAPTCRSWPRGERIYSRDTLGGTDGGSSGSPVVNASDLVVGQLSGACGTNVSDPCDAVNNATVDGAFAYYFSSVKPYLQP